jgi:NADH-quinone oxidoreductase subunit C
VPVRERVSSEEALERVQAALGDRARDAKLNFGHVDITVDPEHLRDVATTLRDAEDLRCRFFTFLSAVDRSEFGDKQKEEGEGPRPGDLEVLVHLYSPGYVLHVNVHVPVDFDEPHCPSITDIYAGALWHERETHEMFGIHFEGHPRLVNLYLSEDFEGHPLRKSFRLPSRFIKEWPGAKDPEEAAAGGR